MLSIAEHIPTLQELELEPAPFPDQSVVNRTHHYLQLQIHLCLLALLLFLVLPALSCLTLEHLGRCSCWNGPISVQFLN